MKLYIAPRKYQYTLAIFCAIMTSCALYSDLHVIRPQVPGMRPYGTVLISAPDSVLRQSGNIYAVDDTETTFMEWFQFLVESNSSELSKFSENNSDFNNYLEDIYDSSSNEYNIRKKSLYSSIPITNISYSDALEFCKWRTRKDSIYSVQQDNQFYNHYYLPSRSFYNWLITASTTDSANPEAGCPNYNFQDISKDYSNCKSINRNKEYNQLFKSRLGQNTVAVGFFYPSKFHIYGVAGNVSEFTSTIGISKGGSFNQKTNNCIQGQDIPYSSPQPWLGFRCVVDIKRM